MAILLFINMITMTIIIIAKRAQSYYSWESLSYGTPLLSEVHKTNTNEAFTVDFWPLRQSIQHFLISSLHTSFYFAPEDGNKTVRYETTEK